MTINSNLYDEEIRLGGYYRNLPIPILYEKNDDLLSMANKIECAIENINQNSLIIQTAEIVHLLNNDFINDPNIMFSFDSEMIGLARKDKTTNVIKISKKQKRSMPLKKAMLKIVVIERDSCFDIKVEANEKITLVSGSLREKIFLTFEDVLFAHQLA